MKENRSTACRLLSLLVNTARQLRCLPYRIERDEHDCNQPGQDQHADDNRIGVAMDALEHRLSLFPLLCARRLLRRRFLRLLGCMVILAMRPAILHPPHLSEQDHHGHACHRQPEGSKMRRAMHIVDTEW